MGSLFSIRRPQTNNYFPAYIDPATGLPAINKDGSPAVTQRPLNDNAGNALYTVTTGTFQGSYTTCTIGYAAAAGQPCVGTSINTRALNSSPLFYEQYRGSTASPRISVGVGVNWNSPFGPLRIDLAKALVSQPGDDKKLITFNVGTQF